MVGITEPNVGMRLRSLRDQKGLSLRALAERCGLSITAISQIERGENSPTVASLHRLANALSIPITDFFHDQARQKIVYVRRDMRLQAQGKGVVIESLGIGLSNQQLEPFHMTIRPGAGNMSDPIHHSGEEFVYCLEGEIEYQIGDQIFRLAQGDSLLFDASQEHAYQNRRQTPAIILLILQASKDWHNMQQLHLEKTDSI